MAIQTSLLVGAYKANRAVTGRTVVYTQGAGSVTLSCVPGRTQFTSDMGDGVVSYLATDDYLFLVSEMAISGTAITPRKGDTISDGGVTHTVFCIGPDVQYRYTDQEKKIIRIHTRKV